MGLKLGGMTFGSLFKKPETILYPFEEKPFAKGLKGFVDNDPAVCILCGICEKRCPTGAISIQKKERTWTIDHFRCVQCQSCVYECPKKCLTMDPHRPQVAAKMEPFVLEVPEQPKKAKDAAE